VTPEDRSLTVRFWPQKAEATVASTRIRCFAVIDGLRKAGIDAALHAPGDRPDVLVLGKRYDEASIQAAQALRRQSGTRLVLDLCDNHFHAEQADPRWSARAEQLKRACLAVDRVVTATPPLADAVRAAVGPTVVTTVIGDTLDTAAASGDRGRGDLLDTWRLRHFLRRHPVADGRRLIWFGHAGTRYAGGGLPDLKRLQHAISTHHRQAPLTLVVVSNDRSKFDEMRHGWPAPMLYLPWSGANFARALQYSQVALIPIALNPYSVCKSNNRLASAFMAGLAVAADAHPSHDPYRDMAVIGDWGQGLAGLMRDGAERQRRIALAQAMLVARHGLPAITAQWMEILRSLVGPVADQPVMPLSGVARTRDLHLVAPGA